VPVEGAPRIIPALPEWISLRRLDIINKLGVEVRTNALAAAVGKRDRARRRRNHSPPSDYRGARERTRRIRVGFGRAFAA
jgi:hypothetical protein